MLNRAQLLGNIGKDPEIRTTRTDETICTLSLATTKKWKDKTTGEIKEKTEWHRVVIFGGRAKACAEYLKKGSKVFIEGEICTRKWTDQAGVERFTTEIVVTGFEGQVVFLDGQRGGNQSSGHSHGNDRSNRSGARSSRPSTSAAGDMDDDPIPF